MLIWILLIIISMIVIDNVYSECPCKEGQESKDIAVSESERIALNEKDILMIFYQPGCRDCAEIIEVFLPSLKEKNKDKILIADYNIDNMSSFEFFLKLQERFDAGSKGIFSNSRIPAVFVHNRFLYGAKEIKSKLGSLIE